MILLPSTVIRFSLDIGKRYKWMAGFEPWEIEIATLPQNIVDALTAKEKAKPPVKQWAPSSGGGTAYGRYRTNWGQKLLPRACQQPGKKTKWTYE